MACCGNKSCTCKIDVGTGLEIEGSGSVADPYLITSTDAGGLHAEGDDNARFNTTVSGTGAIGDPLEIGVDYASTSKLDDIPDVNAPTPGSGQVLAYNTGTHRWVPADPVTAPVGSVHTGPSLDGDGSSGDPLIVVAAADRGLTVAPSGSDAGVGIRDTVINQTIRKFANAAARSAASPSAEVLNTFTTLATSPGKLAYWDGTAWSVYTAEAPTRLIGTEVMLELSDPYADGMPLTHIFAKVDDDVDSNGEFTVLGTSQLAGFSGVLVARFQATNQHPPFYPIVFGDTNRIRCTAYSLGAANATLPNGTNVHGFVEAWCY